MVIREDHITAPLRRFFTQRIFGHSRTLLLAHATNPAPADRGLAARTAALTATIADLRQRQDNLLRELEQSTPSGNHDVNQQWRTGIQTRFAAVLAELRTKQELLAELHRQAQARPSVDPTLLEAIPQEHIDLARLPEDQQRRLYDAFHLELRYNDLTRELGLRVTITGQTAAELGATVAGIMGHVHADPQRARGGSRTRTPCGSRF